MKKYIFFYQQYTHLSFELRPKLTYCSRTRYKVHSFQLLYYIWWKMPLTGCDCPRTCIIGTWFAAWMPTQLHVSSLALHEAPARWHSKQHVTMWKSMKLSRPILSAVDKFTSSSKFSYSTFFFSVCLGFYFLEILPSSTQLKLCLGYGITLSNILYIYI